ncbi:hypothetical protein [Paenibacillus odorifer]|uniref:hypothetical protein n=1 Tax=Paenibacillus odorifer TaxID=189426 RepID=UPI00096F6EE1|nr:hypothetical protein [Paenibacillus odorifer]OMC73011.1 hypothetical protein BK121_08870 [Paenibacillus odorifer]OME55120.1 hypothetical protein BSK61_13715 [Paenibacillus odorifer]
MAIKTVKENSSEQDELIKEKVALSEKIGIWGSYNPIDEFQDTNEFKRIDEIDQRLAEIING